MKKTWNTEYSGNTITVINEWNWSGDTTEEYWINDELIEKRAGNVMDKKLKEGISHSFSKIYKGDTIEIKIGQAWHLCGVACKILVNGEYVGGNRIVFFAK